MNEMRKTKRERAAAALDRTLHLHDRGPRTMTSRLRVAAALNGQTKLRLQDLEWLESVVGMF